MIANAERKCQRTAEVSNDNRAQPSTMCVYVLVLTAYVWSFGSSFSSFVVAFLRIFLAEILATLVQSPSDTGSEKHVAK